MVDYVRLMLLGYLLNTMFPMACFGGSGMEGAWAGHPTDSAPTVIHDTTTTTTTTTQHNGHGSRIVDELRTVETGTDHVRHTCMCVHAHKHTRMCL